MPVHPTAEQIDALVRSSDDGPLVMLNLLRFKPQADGIDQGVTGAEAYARYSVAAEPFLRGIGPGDDQLSAPLSGGADAGADAGPALRRPAV
jgi:hypothetical protein